MFDTLRQSLGLLYARWHFRREHDYHQQLTDFMNRAASILVILPVGYEEATIAGTLMKKLLSDRRDLQLTVVTSGIRATPLNDARRCEIVRMDEVDVNKFFLPGANVLQQILVRSYDVAIDLNLDFVLHTAYICKASQAAVRVGTKQPRSDHFFNVQINLNHTAAPQAAYGKLVDFLKMF